MSENQQQNLENNSAPKSPEPELSPEVLEGVMAKVQDINEKGTAYTKVIYIDHLSFDSAYRDRLPNKYYNEWNDEVAKKLGELGDHSDKTFKIVSNDVKEKLSKKFDKELEEKWGYVKDIVKEVLQHGLIGTTYDNFRTYTGASSLSADYVEALKKEDIVSPVIHANIVGRSDSNI